MKRDIATKEGVPANECLFNTERLVSIREVREQQRGTSKEQINAGNHNGFQSRVSDDSREKVMNTGHKVDVKESATCMRAQ